MSASNIQVGQVLQVGTLNSNTRLAQNAASITYRVQKGDSLYSIAKRHGVDIHDVLRWNSDVDAIKPGDQLTLFVRNNSQPDS